MVTCINIFSKIPPEKRKKKEKGRRKEGKKNNSKLELLKEHTNDAVIKKSV